MPPPPLPYFRGRGVTAAPSGDLVVIRPQGITFREPPGTTALYLPTATLASVEADGDTVMFTGDFRRVDRPTRVRLAPLDPEDARGLAKVLSERFGLPRSARVVRASELSRLTTCELVTVVGTRKRGHSDGPDFEGTRLVSEAPSSDGRYRVTGFLHPQTPGGADASRGFSGPRLAVLWWAPVSTRGLVVGDRIFEIDAAPDGRSWRVLVDGAPLPMTVEETESTTTDSGTDDKPLRAPAPTEWVDAVELLQAKDAFEISAMREGWRASCRVSGGNVAIYNTVVYHSVWFHLTFPTDLSRVAITIVRHTDLSS